MRSADTRRAAVLVFALLGCLRVATAEADTPSPRREYRALVERYRAGDADAAVPLAAWPSSELARTAASLDCFDPGLCEAAAVLHLEAAACDSAAARLDEATAQVAAGRAIVRRLVPDDPGSTPELTGGFAFSWHLAAGYLMQASAFHGPAYNGYVDALRIRPGDPGAWLARATALEAGVLPDGFGGVFVSGEPMQQLLGYRPGAGAAGELEARVGDPASDDHLKLLKYLADQYRRVLAADPSLHEARLRLGRVLAASGQREQARAELRGVLLQANDAFEVALAHLCLARLADRTEEAAAAYRAATEVDPSLRPAWLGLSEAAWRMDDRPAARAALAQVFVEGEAHPLSSWVEYHLGRGRAFRPALAALREAVTRGR